MEQEFYRHVTRWQDFMDNVEGGYDAQLDEDDVDSGLSEEQRQGQRRILLWFFEYIHDAKTPELEAAMKFITGSTRIPISPKIVFKFKQVDSAVPANSGRRWPTATVCFNELALCRSYAEDEEEAAKRDMKGAFRFNSEYGLI